MTPATYAKGGAGAEIGYTTVDSDYGRVLVAATQKGIAAVFLGESDRALEQELKRDFPAAQHRARRRQARRRACRSVLARLYGRKPTALDAPDAPLDIVGTAFQWKVWKALTEIPAGRDPHLWRDRQAHRRARGRPAPSAAPAPPTRRPIVIPCHRAVGSSGALTGYRWGVARKERLLAAERRRSST